MLKALSVLTSAGPKRSRRLSAIVDIKNALNSFVKRKANKIQRSKREGAGLHVDAGESAVGLAHAPQPTAKMH